MSDIDVLVGQRLYALRKNRKISCQKMARFLNIPLKKLKRMESGLDPISAGMLWQIAFVLNCEVREMFPEQPKFRRPSLSRQQKIEAFQTFLNELITQYLITGPDDES